MDERDYILAQKRVKAKKEFYQHLSSFIVMGIFFFLLNAVTAFGRWWFYWPILGWGVGILFHYLDVFGLPGVGNMSGSWEKRALEKELHQIRREKGASGPVTRNRTDQPTEERLELKELEKRKNWDDSELV